MRPIILVLFLLCTELAYSQTAKHFLDQAYRMNSTVLLKQFFRQWSESIPSITNAELSGLNDTIRQTYKVFTAFYKPHHIDSLGGSEFGNDIYKDVVFLIVQNSIKIFFTEKIHYSEQETDDYVVDYITKNLSDSTGHKLLIRTNGKLSDEVLEKFGPNKNVFAVRKFALTDSIVNFRPAINCNGKLPLYLTSSYEELLNSFLGNQNIPLGTDDIMNPARSTKLSEKKKKFLEKYVKIWYGHWGDYWQLYSYPEAFKIIFDKEMKYALIPFRMIYEGGEAMLKNENGEWKLIWIGRTWIE